MWRLPHSAGYTTANELSFLRDLASRGKYVVLANLKIAYRLRSWDGDGMSVDPARVLSELDRLFAGPYTVSTVDHFAPPCPSREERQALEARLYHSNAILSSEETTL